MSSLREERDRFVALAFSAADLLIEADASFKISYAAGASESILGIAADDLVGDEIWAFIDDADIPSVRKLFSRITGAGRLEPIVCRLRRKDGAGVPMIMSGYRAPNLHDHFYLSFSVLRASNAGMLALQAPREEESGLIGEDAFTELAREHLARSQEFGQSSSLTFVEIDNLDEMGAQLGADDRAAVIGEIGAELRSRSVDGLSAGRLSDDRFGVVHAPDVDANALVEDVARSAGAASHGRFVPDLKGATLDLASKGLPDDDALRALTFAIASVSKGDKHAMSIETLEDGYRSMANHAAERISAFREVLKKGQFDVAYQPIVDLKDGSIHHYEALARFESGGKYTSPFEMITFAEEVGLIGDFDLAMLERVAEKVEANLERGLKPSVAVNLSGKSLADPNFVDGLQGVLSRYQRTKPMILFEVTESSEIRDLDAINGRIQQLRRDGHRVCLDDFGAGAAAFHYLRVLEVDLVKIDGIYVRDAINDAQARSFLKAMVALCADLGIETVAEMIEDQETADFLLKSGVRFGQGYYFGKPEIGLDFGANEAPAADAAEIAKLAKEKAEKAGRARHSNVRRRRGAQTTWG